MTEDKYTIKFAPKAFEDLDEIYSYITDDLYNEGAADSLLKKIETSVMRLKEFPFSCSFVTDEILKSKGYRKLVIENYIAFYLIEEEEKQVVVMRVLFGAQKFGRRVLFMQRLLKNGTNCHIGRRFSCRLQSYV
ncbi:type II toxin-antitoxin system RelE/ParE family toxin [Lentibacillus sp. Marseille-P4043]|uniref:type II toxin-antitoxin system RelE/ParE family toxin n=1 Tax=Lentibacillus sp. Marseille-P4043 TaxID=2040293 RepID=UPI000D0B6636|nr:type II toxin-antitoxin system RelE/ParE family toxin [Lentibacillus sp. Marseille-P4043]